MTGSRFDLRLLPGLALLALAGCIDSTTPGIGFGCTAHAAPGLDVEIRDRSTGVPIADSARGVAREGAYVDSLRPGTMLSTAPSDLLSRVGAYERAGTYSIRIERAGYQPWDTAGVRVIAGTCHVTTVRVFARLVPVP